MKYSVFALPETAHRGARARTAGNHPGEALNDLKIVHRYGVRSLEDGAGGRAGAPPRPSRCAAVNSGCGVVILRYHP
jgi:hypothetical protein